MGWEHLLPAHVHISRRDLRLELLSLRPDSSRREKLLRAVAEMNLGLHGQKVAAEAAPAKGDFCRGALAPNFPPSMTQWSRRKPLLRKDGGSYL
jgi:hypothetical protein